MSALLFEQGGWCRPPLPFPPLSMAWRRVGVSVMAGREEGGLDFPWGSCITPPFCPLGPAHAPFFKLYFLRRLQLSFLELDQFS